MNKYYKKLHDKMLFIVANCANYDWLIYKSTKNFRTYIMENIFYQCIDKNSYLKKYKNAVKQKYTTNL